MIRVKNAIYWYINIYSKIIIIIIIIQNLDYYITVGTSALFVFKSFSLQQFLKLLTLLLLLYVGVYCDLNLIYYIHFDRGFSGQNN